MKVRIGQHDFDISRRRAEEFLADGDKVKVTIRFRGREQERPEFGLELLERLIEALGDDAVVEQAPAMEGRNMTMVLAPAKKPASGRETERQETPSPAEGE